jgi:GNAT superfamily N-acetyltransferase
MFEQHYEPICKELPSLGQIALLPWDIETFGFGVADYEIDDFDFSSQDSSRISEHLQGWAKSHDVELVGTTVPASDIRKIYFFQSLGFHYIDMTLLLRYEKVQSAAYPPAELAVKTATADDMEQVMQICGVAFRNGRYHADACFPRDLADRRYQEWVRRTSLPQSRQVLLVVKTKEQVRAFSVVQIDGEQGCLHLYAVAPQWQGKRIGVCLIASTLRYFQQRSVSVVTVKISASNMPAVNLNASLGARFYDPQILLHWHAPWATHLVTAQK